jgi:hypothetical protein
MKPGPLRIALPVPTLERGNDKVARTLTVLIDLMIVPTLQRGNAALDAPASRCDRV